MGLTGKAKKDYQREYMKKQRSNKPEGVTVGLTAYPDIIDKLTDPTWRRKLERLHVAFQSSHHPEYAKDVWLGKIPLDRVFDLLECTS